MSAPAGALRRLAVAAALLALLACSERQPLVSDVAPEFSLPLVGGGTVTLASLRGHTVLIDFWATWCPPCLLEIPELNALSHELDGSRTQILAVSVDSLTPEALAEWLKERDVRYAVALGDTDLAGRYGADAFPFHVVLGPDGKVLERLESGFHDRQQLRDVLARHQAQ
ncbi:MAG TPA: TlpA disulfide reductase family protein [Myxococcota bacterium]|nr:TlpA disulfide reductase family protein [Myxococcota bacterium]